MTQDTSGHNQADPELSPVKRALLEVRGLRAKLDAAERERSGPIAIVGMGCRLPGGVTGPDQLWQLLCDGVDAIDEIPADRWAADAFFDSDPTVAGRMSTRWGGFVDGIDQFDPGFFGISPREAMAMDPQQRLLLEVAWEALEHAGQAPDQLRGSSAGVFMGISSFDYVHLAMSAPPETLDSYLAQGIAHSAASGRLAYVLGCQGPAVSLDTACSSSLMAIHLAVQSLRRGECRLALAGGVNAILLPTFLIGFTKSQMMAADGRCKSFDASADGFVRGEGCGVVVLKRLDDALADRDQIWAVIRGSAVNQDGRSSGLTAPNGLAQEAVIRAALADAHVAPRQVGYVEAHGTGTALGDPIEVQALGAVLGQERTGAPPLRIGSLKTNLGHLEAAAGVTGVIKVAMSLRHGEVPPSLHFAQPNPHIPWEDLPIEVATTRVPFAAIDGRRIGGVSSFGFTGTNVHVVLEAPTSAAVDASRDGAPGDAPRDDAHGDTSRDDVRADRPLHLLKLSAREPAALDRLGHRWSAFLAASPAAFSDICFTANTGRADLPERIAIVAATAPEAADRLAGMLPAPAGSAAAMGVVPMPGALRGSAADRTPAETAFLFSGHGSQYPGMARQLYETQPTFRRALEECDALLRDSLERPLLSVLYPTAADAESRALLVDGMTYSQPALFAVEYALAKLWRAWGVQPAAVLGHSVGEYAAACIAGVFSVADGLKLVAARGRLMDSLPQRGAMLAILAPLDDVEALLAPHAGRVSVAALNGPVEIVVSGEAETIEGIAEALAARGTEFRRLTVAQAGHSHLLDPILDEFEAVAATVLFSAPAIPLISCTTGREAGAGELSDPGYWRRHLRSTVRFRDAIDTMHRQGCNVFLEVGPHSTLAGMGSRCLPDGAGLWLASLRRDWDGWQQMLESLAALYVRGVGIDWPAFERDYLDADGAVRRRIAAPAYSWTHRRYWLEHVAPAAAPVTNAPAPASTAATAVTPAPELWQEVVAAGRLQEAQGPFDLALHRFTARWDALANLSTAVIAVTLRDLGAFAAAAPPCTTAELLQTTGILPKYHRLIERWLHRLTDSSLLHAERERYVGTAQLDAVDAAAAWQRAERASGDWPFLLEYLQRCQDLLPGVLTGRAEALETIFPGGSCATAEQLYRDSVMPRYYNAVAASIVAAFSHGRPGHAVRLLEVGGGTAGTTGSLLPIVERSGGSYLFTDVSDLFLARAAERFGASAHISFGLLDVDRDSGPQGYGPGTYDIIVAANVLHAASDIPAALDRMRSLLAPGGLLLLIEVTSYLDWFDISTALLEGWDRQGDELRPDHPMLARDVWLHALHDAGFTAAAAFPEAGSPAEVMAQHVLVAQAPTAAVPSGGVADTFAAATADARSRGAGGQPDGAFAASLALAAPHERKDLLTAYVRNHIAALLRLHSPDEVERHGRLMELGLDSLMAVELRGRLSRGLTLAEPLPATLIFDYPTVDAIVGLLTRLLEPAATGARSPAELPAAITVAPASSHELDALSDAEVEARLLAKLDSLEERGR